MALLQKRARSVVLKQVDFYNKTIAGKVDPWADEREKLPQLQQSVTRLKLDQQQILDEKDPDKRKALLLPFIAALQVAGPYLDEATFTPNDISITDEQVAELERLESANVGPALPDPKGEVLRPLTPRSIYTLLHLSVPIELQAKPKTEVYFRALAGGQFANGLALQKVVADEKGRVSTEWISKGGAIGQATVVASSPQCVNEINMLIDVVQLTLTPIPELGSITEPPIEIPEYIDTEVEFEEPLDEPLVEELKE